MRSLTQNTSRNVSKPFYHVLTNITQLQGEETTDHLFFIRSSMKKVWTENCSETNSSHAIVYTSKASCTRSQ